jgi:antitoxin component HigA of HigAB toxin-antitoxin module
MINTDTACDILSYNAETVVREHLNSFAGAKPEGQSLVGWYLQNRIEASGCNKKEAAEKMGVSRTFLYALLAGTKKLSDDMITTLVNTMGFTAAELITVAALDTMDRTDG